MASPSRRGPQVISVLYGWAVRTGAGLGKYRTGPFCATLWCLGLEDEKRLKRGVTGCLFSLQHCPFVPRVPCQGRTLPESSVSAALSSSTECPQRIKLFWEELLPGTTFLSSRRPKPRLSQVPTICSAHGLSSVLRVKRFYLSLSGWRGWVVHEGRCSSPPLLARGRNLSGWALAP